MVNTILKEADLFCPNSVRINFTIYLKYTIIRPAWLSNKNIVSYELTEKGEPFKGTEVSRRSIADFVVKLINDPSKHIGASLGVDQPNTQGDKPSFY